ncbi:MAG: type II secretion system protein F [Firmicutes bacterium HGW-Firmicutes-15]|nr:MAG: type II secretion system protein F [Firmicutes bacterium HGW-Firmicutes-15]
MKFEYRVRDQQGRLKVGILEAEHKNIVIENLLGQGYYIVLLNEAPIISSNLRFDFNLYGLKKVRTRDLVTLNRQLSTMLAAGLSIMSSLKILGEQTANKRLKNAVLKIREDIEAGLALWEAFAKHPGIFSEIYISMIRAGELGGVMEVVLERLSYHLEREQEIKSKLKSASIYPVIVAAFAVLVIFFIIIFVMPIFVSMFESSGVRLPMPTLILLGMGAFLGKWWPHIVIGIIVLPLLMKCWGKTINGRYIYDTLSLQVPIIGKTVSRIAVARFARTMGTLVKSGIPVLQALEVTEDVVDNVVIGRAISRARTRIKEGQTIADPLMETGVFEPMVTQMIAVGEETGSLDEMLMRMSDYYERELIYTVDAMMAVLEPMLILVVALMVGGVIVATILPMFDMMNMVG